MRRYYYGSCVICGKGLSHNHLTPYCSTHQKQKQDQEKIDTWKKTGNTQCGVSTTLRNCIRTYILEKQSSCCAICGMSNDWNGKPQTFILDHIDGDASNNWEDNLRLICPNCDSQLPTYKSRNKNSARSHRRLAQ